MIPPKKALKIILDHAKSIGEEEIDISDSLGRTLAEKIYSDTDIPPFDKSAMDGFAINSGDKSETFEVIEDIPAGKVPKKRIKPGQASKIMTGAMLPKGADKVVMVENTKLLSNTKFQISNINAKTNVSLKGEDVKKGELVLNEGTKIRPQETAILATVGKTKVNVYKKPRVAIISTGSELVEPDKKPALGKIRNSNGPMLQSQLKRLGLDSIYLGIAGDDFSITKKMVQEGLKKSDILILSGGVSVGDYDFVHEVLKNCGVKILFNRVAIKPGKPTTFGVKENKLVFGLPGNPVSVLMVFELFVVPAIGKIQMETVAGLAQFSAWKPYKLLSNFNRRDTKGEQYYPVRILKEGILPIDFHGSAHMHALTKADGVMKIDIGVKEFKKGDFVDVRSI